MKRVKHQVSFSKDVPEVVIAELITTTRYYPWWGYPWSWYSNGYDRTTEEVFRPWNYNLWMNESGEFLPMILSAWLDMKLSEDRLRRLKQMFNT